MMKRVILLLSLVLGGCSLLSAQEVGRWSIGLSGLSGSAGPSLHAVKITETKLMPSVHYRLFGDLSLGIALDLPLSKPKKFENRVLSTSAVELQLRQGLSLYKGLKISLTAVGMVGTTGAYRSELGGPWWRGPHKNIEYRWLVGLRPSIAYAFGTHWGLELGYGFVGYRSQKELGHTAYLPGTSKDETYPKGAWGFDAGASWANSLRLGLTYSF
ncbi:hypothetical protein [Porphyromonas sp. COT-239 OH1446]|uniref:hypothetical protein n=1 Tax=Porphyromonas sp. COT-239 OH1446 TaxID=1515613 RepID=UPI000AC82A8B|nr:hypothetical protein [Porphyromonas sp. COT-239 OH1446]